MPSAAIEKITCRRGKYRSQMPPEIVIRRKKITQKLKMKKPNTFRRRAEENLQKWKMEKKMYHQKYS